MNNELEPLLETASRDALVKALRRAVGMIETDANSTDGLDRFLEDRKEELAQLLSAPSVGRVTDEQGGLPVTPDSPPDGTNDAHWIEPGEAPFPALPFPLSEETKKDL